MPLFRSSRHDFTTYALVAVAHSLLAIATFVTPFANPLVVYASPNGATARSDIQDAKKFLRTGDYEACISLCEEQVARGVWNEEWPCLLIEAYLLTGKYQESLAVYQATIDKFSTSLPLRMLGAKAYTMNNMARQSRETLGVIPDLIDRMPWRYSTKDAFVVLGECFLRQGEDPKKVLESYFDRALKQDPNYVPALVASARLALSKNDGQVATKSIEKALTLETEDPDLYLIGALAWVATDSEKASEYLTKALTLNPHHVESLLYQAESRMDSEDYGTALERLEQVANINPKLPKMWALRAAIAHLRGEFAVEGESRRQGLAVWPLNPEVDHVIGKQLAEHYRFEESIRYQRRALEMDPRYLPAQTQLAHDLLRTGSEEGWSVVQQVRERDPYDVSIFNLQQLQRLLNQFATLEAPGLIIRMEAKEARIYGEEVKTLLSEARNVLTQKYQVTLEEPVFVEIFPRQKEFAVRTFGLPGGEGFLGVCFGKLITANSPAAIPVATNWKAMLWHEYCHVATLQKTKNKMPRWLSEGISVYEERERDPRWGQAMTADYRQFLLAEDLVPVSRLSESFQRPKSPLHLQFAYFHASLVIQYWIQTYGMTSLDRVLQDLGVGMPLEEALGRHAGNMASLDSDFDSYARQLAKEWKKETDWERPSDATKPADVAAWRKWSESHPRSPLGLQAVSQWLIANRQWEEAKTVLLQWQELDPENGENEGCYGLLGLVCRELHDEAGEYAAYSKLAERSADPVEALERLMEIDRARQDWHKVHQWCARLMEINPLRVGLQETRAEAAMAVSQPEAAIAAYHALLAMEPIDPVRVHYRLATAYEAAQQWDLAREHVLYALEETPRFREALALLLRLSQRDSKTTSPAEDKP